MDEQDMTVTSGEIVSAPDVTGEWLSPPAAADRLGISERTLWRHVKAGRYHSRVVDRKAEILVPVSGANASSGGSLAVAPLPDTGAIARTVADLSERLSRQSMTVTRQAVQITRLTADRQRLTAERDQAKAELAAERQKTAERAKRRWRWKFWE